MPRFVKFITDDGRTIDAILLDPAESGEGASGPLVFPLDRADAKEAVPGADADTFVEA